MLGHLEKPLLPVPFANFANAPEQYAGTLQNGETHCEDYMSRPDK